MKKDNIIYMLKIKTRNMIKMFRNAIRKTTIQEMNSINTNRVVAYPFVLDEQQPLNHHTRI